MISPGRSPSNREEESARADVSRSVSETYNTKKHGKEGIYEESLGKILADDVDGQVESMLQPKSQLLYVLPLLDLGAVVHLEQRFF